MKVNSISKIASQPIRTNSRNCNTNILKINEIKDTVSFGNNNITKVTKKVIAGEGGLKSALSAIGLYRPSIELVRKNNDIFCDSNDILFNVSDLMNLNPEQRKEYVIREEGVNTKIKPGLFNRLKTSNDNNIEYYGLTEKDGIPFIIVQSKPDVVELINISNIKTGIINQKLENDLVYSRNDENGLYCNNRDTIIMEDLLSDGITKNRRTIYKTDKDEYHKGDIEIYIGDKSERNYKQILISRHNLTKDFKTVENGETIELLHLEYSDIGRIDFTDDGLGRPKYSHRSLYPKKSDAIGTMRGEYKDWYDDNGKVIKSHYKNYPVAPEYFNKANKSISENIIQAFKVLFK